MGLVLACALVALMPASGVEAKRKPPKPKPKPLVIWNVAGNGAICRNPPSCGDGGLATKATLTLPTDVVADRSSNRYIADHTNNEIRLVLAGRNPKIFRLAGTGPQCMAPPACGDGGPAINATLSFPSGVAVDPRGGLYIADTQNQEVRKILPNGIIIRIAGHGTPCPGPPNCGDGGLAINGQLNLPTGVALDRRGNLYIADSANNEIRKVSPNGIITRVAGNGSLCVLPPACGDGGRGVNANLSVPYGVAVDSRNNVYIADAGNNEIRKLSPNGIIHRVAGSGLPCFKAPRCGDGGSALNADLNFPTGVAVDPSGAIYVADRFNQEIRRIFRKKIFRFAGLGFACQRPPACGNGGPAAFATLNAPQGVALDPVGNVLIADSGNNQIRAVGPKSRQPKTGTR